MIKKVRMKFAMLGMIATFVAVVVLVFAINLVNMIQTNRNLDAVLLEMSLQETESGDLWMQKEKDPGDSRTNSGEEEFFAWPEGSASGRKNGKKDLRDSAANQYAGRYFQILLPENEGWIIGEHLQEVPEDDDLKTMIETITGKESASGYLNDYRYLYQFGDAGASISFLDCTTELRAQRRLLWISIAVGAAGILLSFFFIFYVSGKVVRPLKESMEKQKQFITDAGHELKTPLSVIGTNMDILSMDLGENEWVDGTKHQVKKLRNLVNHLISLAKLDEGNVAAEHQKFDLTAAAAESADPFQIMAEANGKELRQEIEEGLTCVGDESQIRQLITILCDNAVKYALETEPILIRLYRDGKKPVLETVNAWNRENAPEDLNRFFDRFYRGDSSRDRSQGQNSYGLGLPIAQSLARKNNIHLTVKEDNRQHLVFHAAFD